MRGVYRGFRALSMMTAASLRDEAAESEEIAYQLHLQALTLEEQLAERGEEWKPSETRLYQSLMARAAYHQNDAILCRLRALEMERGAGP